MKQRPKLKTDPRGYHVVGYSKYSDDEDDGSDTQIELPVRKYHRPQEYIEAQVQDGDTLQAIAIRFNCSVAKLMRANNILRENEIFAKKVLRIPVSAYSLLTESIPMVHSSGTNSPTRNKVKENPPDNVVPTINNDKFQEKLIVATVNASQAVPNTGASSSSNTIEHNEIESEDYTNVTPLLNDTRSRSGVEAIFINEICSKGDNLGMRLCPLLIVIIVIGFVIPLLYIEYVKEHPEKFHHHKNHS